MSTVAASVPYVPILVRGRTSSVVLVCESTSDGSSLTVAVGGTVTLYDRAGASIVSGTTTAGGVVSLAVPAGDAVGACTLLWDVTAGSTPIKIRVNGILAQADLLCPVLSGDIERVIAALETPPSGETTWAKSIASGWRRLMGDLVRVSRIGTDAEIWSSSELFDAALAAAMTRVLSTASGYGAQPWLDHLQRWETQYSHELDRLMVTYGLDADTAPDTDRLRLSAGSGIGERMTGRVG